MKQFCCTCWEPIKVPDNFDGEAACSPKCYWIEWLFCRYYSDDEVCERMVREQDRYLLPPEQTLRR